VEHTITNEQLLQATFGDMWQYAHVCSFPDDPSNISNDRKGLCWSGDYYNRYRLQPGTNQFFCISLFAEEEGKSRRRKKNFSGTYVIGLDDVREKLSPAQAERLPVPTYKLKSSMFSEQWFYVLKVPETNRNRVDNLLDQLIANGLAPDGKDPGMKGVTRYLRLPEGYNTKASRVRENNGTAPACELIEWKPENKYTMEELAIPFDCDLDAQRADVRTTGAVEMNNHPVLKQLNVKNMLSGGRYDITCPWVDEHSDNDDSGSAIFTNDDGSFGFQCHHGHCQERTAGDVLASIDRRVPGFKSQFHAWRNVFALNAFDSLTQPDFMGSATVATPDFMGTSKLVQPAKLPAVVEEEPLMLVDMQTMIDAVRMAYPNSEDRKIKCEQFVRTVDSFTHADRIGWHDQIMQIMGWSKSDFQKVLKDYRKAWYSDDRHTLDFFKDWVYISSQNQFYNIVKHTYLPIDSFRNSYIHLDPDVLNSALRDMMSKKVDAVDYVPGRPLFFEENDIDYVNSWDDRLNYGVPGNCDMWLSHWETVGWEEHRAFMLQWMRHTVVHPEDKINYAMMLGSREGGGKDFLLYPMMKALGTNSVSIEGDSLLENFNEYLLSHKHLHFNEVELGDHHQATAIYNKLKPIIAAPPDRLNVNIKGLRSLSVRNLFNVTITSNKYVPLQVDKDSRRFFMLWTDFTSRDENRQVIPEWNTYWNMAWNWMLDESEGGQGGWRSCVYHMVNNVSEQGFDPKSPPFVTDYMKEVQDMSMSTLEFEISTLVEERVGCFQCDLVTSHDALNTLRVHSQMPGNVTASTVGKVLSAMGYRGRLRPVINGTRRRLYTIRNSTVYDRMQLSEVGTTYITQKQATEMQGKVVSIDDKSLLMNNRNVDKMVREVKART